MKKQIFFTTGGYNLLIFHYAVSNLLLLLTILLFPEILPRQFFNSVNTTVLKKTSPF